LEKMELKLKNNYMAKRTFLKNNPSLKHAGRQVADVCGNYNRAKVKQYKMFSLYSDKY